MTGEAHGVPAGARADGQRVPAPRVCDLTDDDDLFQFAETTDLVRGMARRKAGGKSIATKRRSPRIQEHDVIRHQVEQLREIAGVHRLDPACMDLADESFIICHLRSLRRPPPPRRRIYTSGRAVDTEASKADVKA